MAKIYLKQKRAPTDPLAEFLLTWEANRIPPNNALLNTKNIAPAKTFTF